MASVVPRSLVLSVLIACNPVPPGGEPGTTTGASTTSGETDGVSSSSVASTPTTTGGTTTDPATGNGADTTSTGTTALETSTTTDAVSTTSGDTTMEPPSPTSWTGDPGDDTTEGFVCNWNDLDTQGFCPLPASPSAAISGTTPLGPIDFKYAYFGLYPCDDCPSAGDGQLAFFVEPNGPMDPKSDRLVATNHIVPRLALSLGGGETEVDGLDEDNEVIVVYMEVDIPSLADTNPPLDPNVPPVLTGKLSITGGGWDVSGEFTATLCRKFDLSINCA